MYNRTLSRPHYLREATAIYQLRERGSRTMESWKWQVTFHPRPRPPVGRGRISRSVFHKRRQKRHYFMSTWAWSVCR